MLEATLPWIEGGPAALVSLGNPLKEASWQGASQKQRSPGESKSQSKGGLSLAVLTIDLLQSST